MATLWPYRDTWPTPLREHAINLSAFAYEILHLIERIGDIIRGSLTFVLKVQHTSDLSALSDALKIAQTEAKINAENTVQALGEIKNQILKTKEIAQRSATNIQQNGERIKEVGVAAREATEVGRNVSYAAVAARNLPPAAQIQREVIINIRDPFTIQSLRAMNPRNLKAHIVSANQLKSRDLSIKTAASNEVKALRQTGATVRIPTYSVLAHGICTSTIDIGKFEQNRLTRDASAKSASTITIKFTRLEDLLCARTRHPELPIKIEPGDTKEMCDLQGRPRSMESPMPNQEGRDPQG
ncbi:hypothetical protein HBH70_248940 [Parastagonospora nodorum]|nr:hypothetical protein HBH43_247940 [Parastagonospora nodorum]KAH4399736.1 hypothetical protein HBH93_247070 [Parastagonospora nodorum]KAH4399823.1 hypothetical protein HBH92_246240 [Parastagonospora nodorum]KAH4427830.1 hypothetical protein HBH91_247840 [Parastagonospora nodorum]KAH4481912.1 hypothetical protein HBH89_245410 [Parastagonospora nodorum]